MTASERVIWIFGGTGFIGSNLVRYLSQTSSQIQLLVHKKADFHALENHNCIMGSISEFDPFWFKKYPPDVLFHLARPAGSNIVTRTLSARAGERANRRLVRILEDLPRPPVIVYVSGSLMYGERRENSPAHENTGLKPSSFAGFYYRNELPWIEAQQNELLDIRFARPGWIAGPGSWFMEYFWKPFLKTGKIPQYGDGGNIMALSHIGDCVSMINSLSVGENKSVNLNIFSVNIRHSEFCSILASLLGTETFTITTGESIRLFGRTTTFALTSSIPMITKYPEMHKHAALRFNDARSLLGDVLRLLQNK